MKADLLLHSPIEYFRGFPTRRASLAVALVSFLLIALAEAVPTDGVLSADEIPGALMWVILNWVFGITFFAGLWFFLGARVLGGKGSFGATVRAVGYAFLVPGVVTLAFALLTAGLGKLTTGAAVGVLGIKTVLGLWSICLAGIAVRFTHSLTWQRALLVVVWMPAFLLGLWLVIAVIIVLTVPFA
jgi:hypothetical protein